MLTTVNADYELLSVKTEFKLP